MILRVYRAVFLLLGDMYRLFYKHVLAAFYNEMFFFLVLDREKFPPHIIQTYHICVIRSAVSENNHFQ